MATLLIMMRVISWFSDSFRFSMKWVFSQVNQIFLSSILPFQSYSFKVSKRSWLVHPIKCNSLELLVCWKWRAVTLWECELSVWFDRILPKHIHRIPYLLEFFVHLNWIFGIKFGLSLYLERVSPSTYPSALSSFYYHY